VPTEEQSEESISLVVGCNKPRFFISAAAINFYRPESATFQQLRPPYLILLPAKAIQRNFYYCAQIRSLLVLWCTFCGGEKAAAAVQVALAQLSYLIATLQIYLRVERQAKTNVCQERVRCISRVNIERRPRRLSYHTTRGKTNKTDARRECSCPPPRLFENDAKVKNSPFALTWQYDTCD
jgi:hypothetical protein